MPNTLYVQYAQLEHGPIHWHAMLNNTLQAGVAETEDALNQCIAEQGIDSVRIIIPSWLMAVHKLDIDKSALKYLNKTLRFKMEPFLANGVEDNQYQSFQSASKNVYGVAIESSILESVKNKVEGVFPDCHIQFSSIACAVVNSMSLTGAMEVEGEVITMKDSDVCATPIDLCDAFDVTPDSQLPYNQLVEANAFVPIYEAGQPKRKKGAWLWKVTAAMVLMAFAGAYGDAWYEAKQKAAYAQAVNEQTASAYLQAFPNERIVNLKRQVLAKVMQASNSDNQKTLTPTEAMMAVSKAVASSGAQGHLVSIKGESGFTSIEWSSHSADNAIKIESALNGTGIYRAKAMNVNRTNGQFISRLTLEIAQ